MEREKYNLLVDKLIRLNCLWLNDFFDPIDYTKEISPRYFEHREKEAREKYQTNSLFRVLIDKKVALTMNTIEEIIEEVKNG